MSDCECASSSSVSCGGRFERAPWCYLLWGVPLVLAVAAGGAYRGAILSLTGAGILWTVGVAWLGIGCLINGWSCGRVHCRIDGILFPILSIIGILNILSILSFSWSIFWLSFLAILAASYIPEFAWKRYV